MARQLKTTCLKCNSEITLDFGDADYSQAKKDIEKLDRRSMECPGWHVEFNGWKKYWQLEKAVEEGYTQEEKEACEDTVKEISVKLHGSLDPDTTHTFSKEDEVLLFLHGFSEHNEKNLASDVDVTYYNYFGNEIGGFQLSVNQALSLLK